MHSVMKGALLLLLLLVACGEKVKETQELKGSCNLIYESGVCVEFYHGFRPFEVRELCREKEGLFSKSSCPAEGSVALCKKRFMGREGIQLYYDSVFSLRQAKDDCENPVVEVQDENQFEVILGH